jgi:hypothetical protein
MSAAVRNISVEHRQSIATPTAAKMWNPDIAKLRHGYSHQKSTGVTRLLPKNENRKLTDSHLPRKMVCVALPSS